MTPRFRCSEWIRTPALTAINYALPLRYATHFAVNSLLADYIFFRSFTTQLFFVEEVGLEPTVSRFQGEHVTKFCHSSLKLKSPYFRRDCYIQKIYIVYLHSNL